VDGFTNELRRVEDPDLHLLVTPNPDGWSLSGLFDFEPAMHTRAAPIKHPDEVYQLAYGSTAIMSTMPTTRLPGGTT
jgi:hypothetical protein